MPGGTIIPEKPVLAPIGGILAWLKSFTNTPALPLGWVECNGQTLNDADSVYNGRVIPNLNGGESTHTLTTNEIPSHSHAIPANPNSNGMITLVPIAVASGSTISTAATGGGAAHENKPPYYDVVWIMRVK